MDNNVYIEIPGSVPGVTPDVLKKCGASIAGDSDMVAYFGADLQLECSFYRASGSDLTITVMPAPKYSGYDNDIKEQLRSIITGYFPSVSGDNIEIRVNYTRFNPGFKPEGVNLMDASAQVNNSVSDDEEKTKGATSSGKSVEFDYEKLARNYVAQEPRFSFDQVILAPKTLEQIEHAIGVIKVEKKVFDEWGLRSIIPTASSALSFYGPPGTGKSMAAEAIAQKLGKKVLSATYADIESKFHGEGPKMVKALFMAAERDDAVLFLDESDSLLSKRLTNVSEGSAQAINSMRSQLLISLERFKGIVIFATNLVVNYDRAFLSRLINIEFLMPTAEDREKIWWQHLRTKAIHIPLADDVDVPALAERYEFCGREIKSAVKGACVEAALEGREQVGQSDFVKSCDITKEESLRVTMASDHTVSQQIPLTPQQKDVLKDAMQKHLDGVSNVQKVTQMSAATTQPLPTPPQPSAETTQLPPTLPQPSAEATRPLPNGDSVLM